MTIRQIGQSKSNNVHTELRKVPDRSPGQNLMAKNYPQTAEIKCSQNATKSHKSLFFAQNYSAYNYFGYIW